MTVKQAKNIVDLTEHISLNAVSLREYKVDTNKIHRYLTSLNKRLKEIAEGYFVANLESELLAERKTYRDRLHYNNLKIREARLKYNLYQRTLSKIIDADK